MMKMVSNEFSIQTYATIAFLDYKHYFWVNTPFYATLSEITIFNFAPVFMVLLALLNSKACLDWEDITACKKSNVLYATLRI